MPVMQSAPGPETTVDGRRYLYFCGTGYLGLQGHPDLIRAATIAMQQYGLGTATTRAGYGSAPPIVDVEKSAARFWDRDEAFYFASGYLGNHVALSAVAESADVVLLDERSHYSIVDACRCLNLPVHRFAHRDAQSLREALRDHVRPRQAPIVMSDGVFASSGAIAPVTDYLDELRGYEGAVLCLDDCHAVGVLGERGRGVYEYHGLGPHGVNELPRRGGPPQLLAVGTLSKAFGGYGGVAWGSRSFIEKARNSTHYFRGASAPPTPVAAASAAALELVARTPELVAQVQRNARLLKQGLRSLGLDVDDTPSPIVGLALGDAENMRRIQRQLAESGVLIAYSEKYSGLDARGGLRLAVFATHTPENIHELIDQLGRRL